MVGIGVISHGALCEGLLNSIGMIAGEVAQGEVLSLRPGMSPDDYRRQLNELVDRLDSGQGVLVLTDILGGTPFNTAATLMRDQKQVAVVTGVNLPMLIAVSLERTEDTTLDELAKKALNAGSEGIKILTADMEAQEDEEEI